MRFTRPSIFVLLLVLCSGVPAPGQDPVFTFQAPSLTAGYDPDNGQATVAVTLSIQQSSDDLDFPVETEGFSFALSHDPDVLSPVVAEPAGVVSELNDGDGPEFFAVNFDLGPDDGVVVAVVYDILPPGDTNIEYVDAEPVITLSYDGITALLLDNDDGAESALTWTNDLGDSPPISNIVTVDGQSIDPEFVDGTISLIPSYDVFLRGDMNGDGTVFALLDALYLLEWQFLGGEPPPCVKAADVDDSGAITAITEALALLLWQFADGDPPSSPGPDTCGLDPTADALDCATPPLCP